MSIPKPAWSTDGKNRMLRCVSCREWIYVGNVPDADFERMLKIGVRCGDCVTNSVADYEEEMDS